jgi:3-isopropylmalate dehydrogenase
MSKYNITLIPGDGIGPEVINEARKILEKIGKIFQHEFHLEEAPAGGAALDAVGEPLPKATVELARSSDSVLLGAVGGPKWDNMPGNMRPEMAILGLRKELGLFANLRPALLFDELKAACPLKPEIIQGGLDILVVRELTGGIYFGEKGTRVDPADSAVEIAYDVEQYSTPEIERIAITAFEMAKKRQSRLCSVDKANVLESSRLWRRTVEKVAAGYPSVKLDHLYIDNAAMQLVRNPKQFDVILTSNIFGDILSDEASQITGSIGMLPSASLASSSFGLYEPIHGSAPDIAGTGKANPIATILSVAMMLKYSFSLEDEAAKITNAVEQFLQQGYRTADIFTEGKTQTSTEQTGSLIADLI